MAACLHVFEWNVLLISDLPQALRVQESAQADRFNKPWTKQVYRQESTEPFFLFWHLNFCLMFSCVCDVSTESCQSPPTLELKVDSHPFCSNSQPLSWTLNRTGIWRTTVNPAQGQLAKWILDDDMMCSLPPSNAELHKYFSLHSHFLN